MKRSTDPNSAVDNIHRSHAVRETPVTRPQQERRQLVWTYEAPDSTNYMMSIDIYAGTSVVIRNSRLAVVLIDPFGQLPERSSTGMAVRCAV